MIATQQETHQVKSTLSGRVVNMGIDAAAVGHVMNVLTNMYEDAEEAVIREYAANARDSMVEAGREAFPIEVHTPGPLAPLFRVKDTGIGLNATDIAEIYSQYGASTKRDTNGQVGMFGIGCKSALAYADQFTLVGIKDGTRTQVSISRSKEGGGAMTIVSETPTTDQNGVEIIVPVSGAGSFEEKCKDFFGAWEKGTVLVNGNAPKSIWDDALRITDDIYVQGAGGATYGRANASHHVVVMGNVPYKVPISRIPTDLPYGSRLLVRVPIGSCNVPPARESLSDDARTKDTLAVIVATFNKHVSGAIQAKIDEATSRIDARLTMRDWQRALGEKANRKSGHYTYKGTTIPHLYEVPKPKACSMHDPATGGLGAAAACSQCGTAPHMVLAHGGQRDYAHHTKEYAVQLRNIEDALIVTGYDRTSFTATAKKKLLQYAADKGIAPAAYLMVPDIANSSTLSWVKNLGAVRWDDVWATKLPKNHTHTYNGRPQGAYDMTAVVDANYGRPQHTTVAVDDIPANAVYVAGATKGSFGTMSTILGRPVITLPTARVEKFKRENPQYPEGREVLQQVQSAALKQIKGDALLKLTFSDYYTIGLNHMAKLDEKDVHDPAVKRHIRIAKLDVKREQALLGEAGLSTSALSCNTYDDPMSKYPLLGDNDINKHPQHAVLYLNAAYAAQQKGAS